MDDKSRQLAVEHHTANRLDEAEAIYRDALERDPNDAVALHLLGVLTHQKGDFAGSVELLERAIAVNPQYSEASYALGQIYMRDGQLGLAARAYSRVLQLNSGNFSALKNLGDALKGLGRIEESLACFAEAARVKPEMAEAWFNLGSALRITGRYAEAEKAYRRAVEIRADFAEAISNLGATRAELGRVDDAIANCRRAIELMPGVKDGYSSLLYALYHDPNCDGRKLLEETRAWSRRQVTDNYVPRVEPLERRRIRVGYLSPFFTMCSDALFIPPVLSGYDRSAFEVFCFTRAVRDDDLSAWMRGNCDHWIDLRRLATTAAVETIRKCRLDLLVVISLPADECQKITAHRCAPVQMLWLTYSAATSGLATMDYRISDPFLDPSPQDESCYQEKTVRLPETAWCYEPIVAPPEITALPMETNGYVTFGWLGRVTKLNSRVARTWASLMEQIPNSRLILLANAGGGREEMAALFESAGMDIQRIEFVRRMNRGEYLKTYGRFDVSLDTWPFSGHTTAMDSLWMGVPVVTLAGKTCVGRAAASALRNLGMAEFVAGSEEEFSRIAGNLARDPARMAELRAGLRQTMQKSPLMDGSRFVRNLEELYRHLLGPALESNGRA
jgi:predicted O-linked N-acetylglucosamine transferase (SPINDLY family)